MEESLLRPLTYTTAYRYPIKYFRNTLPDYEVGQKVPIDVDQQQRRTLDLAKKVLKNFKNERPNVEGGLYTGLAGVSYMLYHIAKLPQFKQSKDKFLDSAINFLQLSIQEIPHTLSYGKLSRKTGFITGLVGIYAVAAVLYNKLGNKRERDKFVSMFSSAAKLVEPIDWHEEKGGDELFVGRAGYLCGLLWLRKELGMEVVSDNVAFRILDTMAESGTMEARKVASNLPLLYQYNGTYYFGPAHGLSGVLLIMLRFPTWLELNPKYREAIRSTIDALLLYQTPSGNFPSSLGRVRPDEDELTHWCHGAPGVVHLLARAYQVFQDENYLQRAIKCGEVTWQKGLLRKGPGLCHGLASSGYVFLLLYKLTQDEKHLHRALAFSQFYFEPEFEELARRPDSPFSLFEGMAGFACYSADLCQPGLAEFPFLPFD